MNIYITFDSIVDLLSAFKEDSLPCLISLYRNEAQFISEKMIFLWTFYKIRYLD